MIPIPTDLFPAFLSRMKLFFALSRTPHGLIDMATPAFAALVWLGHMPPVSIVFLGLLTTFSGYTAVYALNDLVDFGHDQDKAHNGGICPAEGDLDAVLVRHPMACGLLTFREGLAWTSLWMATAIIGAYLLNPVCLCFFALGCLLEILYCILWRVSHYRVLISGAVKTLGAVAAVFAVDTRPSAGFMMVLFLTLFFWEIGGQNIPNDWTDIEADSRFGAKTIPIRLGTRRSGLIILGSVLLALLLNAAVFKLSAASYSSGFPIAALCAGIYLLLLPAVRLWFSQSRQDAMNLFNKGSYYPLMLLGIVCVWVLS